MVFNPLGTSLHPTLISFLFVMVGLTPMGSVGAGWGETPWWLPLGNCKPFKSQNKHHFITREQAANKDHCRQLNSLCTQVTSHNNQENLTSVCSFQQFAFSFLDALDLLFIHLAADKTSWWARKFWVMMENVVSEQRAIRLSQSEISSQSYKSSRRMSHCGLRSNLRESFPSFLPYSLSLLRCRYTS